ncbi:MAG: histidine kinase, partial [Oscillospiraceae bacterium]
FLRGIAVVNIGVALALLFILINIQFEHEITLRQQEKELAELRIDIMLSQIQPHFLYNVLTGIRNLCETNPNRAVESITTFSKFLRTNMESLTDKHPIPFEKELSHTQAYLQLEQQRFGDKLKIVYEIETVDFSIPPLTLQPIAENAVRHGLMKKENGGTLTIRSGEEEKAFFITITDDGLGFSQKQLNSENDMHIGIANVRNRLQTLCSGTVNIQSQPNKGTTVTIYIPKEGEKH